MDDVRVLLVVADVGERKKHATIWSLHLFIGEP
jgi:hypothetical protein